MDKALLRKFIPHIAAILLFLILPAIYFSPQLDGKKLNQHDTNTATGMAREITEYNKTHSDLALWTNSMFGGMPAYLIGMPTFSLLTPFYNLTTLFDWRPISFVFLYLLGFYIALLLVGLNPWIALFGAIAFGFSSYNFIIITAGHNTKAIAIGYMAPVIASLWHAWYKNKWVGSALFAFFLALQIYANHLQITYYTILVVLVFGVVELVMAIKGKTISQFLSKTALVALFALLAIAANTERLWTTWEYGNFSLRGPSELTREKGNSTSGLDKDYATGWSYDIDETLTLLIPNFKGGASAIDFGMDSSTASLLKSNNVPNAESIIRQLPGYWGTQPGTSGPVYAGAIVLFLFILGLFLEKGPFRTWIISITILSILLSWGRNFMPLTSFFLDYFPGYNKFRTVSMILVIASFAIPFLAFTALNRVFNQEIDKATWNKALAWSAGITAGISFLFILLPGLSGSFVSASDSQMPGWLQSGLVNDRKAFLRSDAVRSLLFILVAAAVLWAFYLRKLKAGPALAILGIAILADMWGVDKRYLNNDNFVQEQKARNPYPITTANKEILKDKSEYRVLNLTVDPFNEAGTSFYHHSIGGYHGAKMRRYQDVIEKHIGREIQQIGVKLNALKSETGIDSVFMGLNALNMLNTRYLIYNPDAAPLVNSRAMGSAWLVRNYQLADTPDMELEAIGQADLKNTVIVNKKFSPLLGGVSREGAASEIRLKSYSPNELVYSYAGKGGEIAVFSEIYYPKGWNAYINGSLVPHFQANYLLRAMVMKEGSYDVTFRFEPLSYRAGKKISVASSLILILIIGFVLYKKLTLKTGTPE